MSIQINEAEDLVGLLSYECDEKAMSEAAEILRQVCVDFWSRVAIENESGGSEDLDDEDTNFILEEDELHQIAV